MIKWTIIHLFALMLLLTGCHAAQDRSEGDGNIKKTIDQDTSDDDNKNEKEQKDTGAIDEDSVINHHDDIISWSDKSWSGMVLDIANSSSSVNHEDEETVRKEITYVLKHWIKLQNDKNLFKMKSYIGEPIYSYGKKYATIHDFKNNIRQGNKKNEVRIPQRNATVDFLIASTVDPIEYWSVRFHVKYIRNDFVDEVFLILERNIRDDDGSDWRIVGESSQNFNLKAMQDVFRLHPVLLEDNDKKEHRNQKSCLSFAFSALWTSSVFNHDIIMNFLNFDKSDTLDLTVWNEGLKKYGVKPYILESPRQFDMVVTRHDNTTGKDVSPGRYIVDTVEGTIQQIDGMSDEMETVVYKMDRETLYRRDLACGD